MRLRRNLLPIGSFIPIVSLVIGCGGGPTEPETGRLEVSTATTGSAVDSDGYTVVLNRVHFRPIGVRDTIAVAELSVGEYDVELTGLANNCGVVGENPATTSLARGQTTRIDFTIACPPFHDHIAFNGADGHIYVVNSDGSNRVSVTKDLAPEPRYAIDWSPDGTRLMFRGFGDRYVLWVMRVDGSEPTVVARHYYIHDAEWSPDGTRIVFTGGDDNHDVWTVEPDGSNPINLTHSPGLEFSATWSPNASRIAFTRGSPALGLELHVMDADGANQRLLRRVTGSMGTLAWSPDGTRIAYAGNCETGTRIQEVCFIGSDGSNPVNLTNHPAADWQPDWSPDGAKIAFMSRRGSGADVYTIWADGSGVEHIAEEGGVPAWSPGP